MRMTLAIPVLISCLSGVMENAAQGSTIPWFSLGHLQALGNTERSASQTGRHDVLADIRPLLAAKTSVPLRLPDLHVVFGEKAGSLYAILENADSSHYEIQIALTNDCTGGNYCHAGTVRGGTAPLVENEGRRVPLTLEGGIKGYFVDFACGAHCDDSSVGWKEGGYYYSISLKAAKLGTLVKLANSAIVRGHKQRVERAAELTDAMRNASSKGIRDWAVWSFAIFYAEGCGSGSNPGQASTGSGGYWGYRGSVSERRQR